jgi:hypothetical protein
LLASHRRQRSAIHDARRIALAAPGALSVQRYREPSGMPAEWRVNLPRGPGVHVPARLLAVTFIMLLAVSGTGLAVGHERAREARAVAALAEADAALQRALENPGTATSSLAEAETAMDAARDAGADAPALTASEQKLVGARDALWGVQRLRDVVRLGALPRERDSGPVRLALSGRTLYLAAGDLYELDADAGFLISLLKEGDTIGEDVVGDLRYVSVDDGNIIASDGAAAYRRDERGTWRRQPLAVDDVGGLRADGPLIFWGDAAYGLTWDGDIARFDQTAGGPVASTWAAAIDTPDLVNARDMAIDGQIHVLLEDGRTLTFSLGRCIWSTATPAWATTRAESSALAVKATRGSC